MINDSCIKQLLSQIESGECIITKHLSTTETYGYLAAHYGNVSYITDNGWLITVFFDCGEWDYIDSITSPEGETIMWEDLSSELRYYQPPKQVEQIIYGSPGYLGRYLRGEND